MENALLYTFSTIAQALGGTFALLAAFVLYRFQLLATLMASDADNLEQANFFTGEQKETHIRYKIAAQYPEAIRHFEACEKQESERRPGKSVEWGGAAKPALARLKLNVRMRSALARWFIISGIATAALLIGSVVAIPFAQVLRDQECWARLVLILGCGGFSACIALYGVVIAKALELKRDPKA